MTQADGILQVVNDKVELLIWMMYSNIKTRERCNVSLISSSAFCCSWVRRPFKAWISNQYFPDLPNQAAVSVSGRSSVSPQGLKPERVNLSLCLFGWNHCLSSEDKTLDPQRKWVKYSHETLWWLRGKVQAVCHYPVCYTLLLYCSLWHTLVHPPTHAHAHTHVHFMFLCI